MTGMGGVPSAIIGIAMNVIPAKAGIHATLTGWIPACAGMTAEGWGCRVVAYVRAFSGRYESKWIHKGVLI